MQKKPVLTKNVALGLAFVMLLVALVMGFLAWQCLTTDLYKLYSAPYQGCSSRYEYYEKQAKLKQQEAEQYQSLGQESLALNASLTAENWQHNADEAKRYMFEHRNGAVALGIATLLAAVLAVRFYLLGTGKKRVPAAKPAAATGSQPQV